jgi:hypothetical protein
VALPTEAWRGAEICRRSAENSYVDLPGPLALPANVRLGWTKWLKVEKRIIDPVLGVEGHCVRRFFENKTKKVEEFP